MAAAGRDGLWGLMTLTVFSAAVFRAGVAISALPHDPRLITRIDAAAGALLTSAHALVVPHVLSEHAGSGAIGILVGLAILAHKAPAGYVLARRLTTHRGHAILVVPPALGTGLGALCVAMMPSAVARPAGLIFGAAAGLFRFVGLAFVASSAKTGALDSADWAAFVAGGTAIALTGWAAPHGI